MALFPPGKGGGKGVVGYKGKGVTIHSLVDGNGMPMNVTQTAANDDERKQVKPLLEGICVRTGKRGRPRKRFKRIGFDKGYDDQKIRKALRKKGIEPEIPKRVWKTKKKPGRPLTKKVPRFKVERAFSWYQRKFRRLTTRWERIPQCFDFFLQLALVFMWVPKILIQG